MQTLKKTNKSSSKPLKNEKSGTENSLIWLIPFVLGFLVMGNALWNDFVEWDDNRYVYDNTDLGKWNAAGWKYLITSYVMGNWHPLTMMSLSLDKTLFDLNPMGFHFTNILLHALNSLLVYILTREIVKEHRIALIASALFAVHPLHVESVAWISERKDVLYTFFTLLSLVYWQKYLKAPEHKTLIISLILFFLACTAKAQAVVMPVLAGLMLWYTDSDKAKKPAAWLPLLPHFILAFIIGIVAIDAQAEGGNVRVFRNYNGLDQILIACQGFLLYLFKTLVPIGQSAYYPYPEKTGTMLPWFYYAAPLILGLLIYFVFRIGKHKKIVLFAAAFFVIAILPVLQILPVGETMISERYYYLPSAGLFILMANGFEYLKSRISLTQWLPWIFTGIMGLLCMMRVQIWNNTYRLFLDVMHKYDNVPVAYNNIANQFTKDKKYDIAIPMYLKALDIRPDYAIGWHNLGNNYTHTHRYSLALDAFTQYMTIRPDDEVVFKKLGTVYSKMGSESASANRIEEAEKYFLSALEYDASLTECYVNLGNIAAMRQDYNTAEIRYKKALELNPENSGTWFNMGMMLVQSGRNQEGIESIRKAASLGNGQASGWLQQFAPQL